ncbi:hypothetical protein SAMN05421510_10312 [Nitrosomonas ureae]|uniref:Uncharacterized protein n=2 Tax=Nitrosomonas ureae TaxID=44577 RepID=A0A1H9EFJ7_9PROT|nr:hypothetical protein SAMN05421510_10312 [Nitrosomonas ureae]
MLAATGIVMSTSIEKYRKRLASFNFSKDREDDFLNYFYNAIKEFVTAAHKKHPVQQALNEKEQDRLEQPEDVIDSDNRTIQKLFRNASNGN